MDLLVRLVLTADLPLVCFVFVVGWVNWLLVFRMGWVLLFYALRVVVYMICFGVGLTWSWVFVCVLL